ncbi:MAG: dTDP-4-amino-4,6-dideoxygalactose transaminase [Deltaproteobacteria bacterium]|nr:dTDP-4-amino-4,6-dideoxygalactose transaminase [Deltaproteobacteria bacterium]
MRIPFNKPFIVGKELSYMAEAVLSHMHLSGDGPFSRKCEKWLEVTLGCHRALLTHSGTAALEMAAILCDVKPGDEIIMPSFTFVSTANAFVLRGGVPVFIDIRADTLNLDEELIPQAITPETKGIVPVHYAGVSCAMDAIMELAAAHHLWVVEDAAQALLSSYKGRFLGTIGHLGCLSFHETKNIISGEGGALLVNSAQLIDRAEIVRDKGTNRKQFFLGQVDKYSWMELGSSFLPSDLIGAFLYAQLEQADKIIKARCRLFSQYDQWLRPLEERGFLRLPVADQDQVCNGHLYYIVTGSPEERTKLTCYLADRGIAGVFHYVPLHSSPAGRRYGRTAGDMSNTDIISRRLLRLPMFYEMTAQDQALVAEAIIKFYSS